MKEKKTHLQKRVGLLCLLNYKAPCAFLLSSKVAAEVTTFS